MDIASRLNEAVKQTRIAIEDTENPQILGFLERGLESLENALESLDVGEND